MKLETNFFFSVTYQMKENHEEFSGMLSSYTDLSSMKQITHTRSSPRNITNQIPLYNCVLPEIPQLWLKTSWRNAVATKQKRTYKYPPPSH